LELLSTQAADAPGRAQLQLHFSLRDGGIGIKPEKLARLFKPFMAGREIHRAALRRHGLGLAISKRLVN